MLPKYVRKFLSRYSDESGGRYIKEIRIGLAFVKNNSIQIA